MAQHKVHGLTGRARPHLLALEPRMMFDAAMAATTEAVAAERPTDAADAHRDVPHDIDRPHVPDTSPDLVLPERTAWREAAPAEPSTAREIVFIDTAVADYRQLADTWASRGEVVLIDSARDGIDQVRAALAGRSDVAAIHIVSHGEAGAIFLGTTRIDAASIDGNLAGSLAAIGRSLSVDGDILLYGCDFAEGPAGERALARFAAATGADVAASTDLTGAASRGGDWDLEARQGLIEAAGLDGGNWAHTLAPNTPVPISVAVGSLTVRDSSGTVVFSAADGYNNNAARSPDVGVGAVATWANAASYTGHNVDLKATVVSLTSGDAVQFNRVTGTGTGPDDPTFLLRDLTAGNTAATVQLRWELVDHDTGQALPADVRFTIADIDGIGGNARSRETVTASTTNLAYYTRERVSDIRFTSTLDAIEASGTQDENNPVGQTLTPQSAATFDWSDVSAFTLTYTLSPNSVTSNAQFYHDGDADFAYNDPVYVSVPRLDLDGDNSTASGNDAHFTYTENGGGIAVVDSDVRVVNPMPSAGITGGTVALTNAKAGDLLSVGTLPSTISASVDTATTGRIVVTLSGNGSEADYAAAFQAITFRSSTDNPDTTQRVIEVSFSNDTLTSALATSRIDVVAVNDAPVANPDTATTREDTAVVIDVLANDTDAEGDALTITGASALHGTVTIDAGTLRYTPDADFNGDDTITSTINDGHGGTASSTVAVTVTPVNDAPYAKSIPHAYAGVDGARVSVPVAGAFGDVDNDTLTYAASGLPAGLSIDPSTGVLSGTIDHSASQVNGGRYSVRLTATDPAGASAVQDVVLTITNPAPTARNDTATTAEDTPVTLDVRVNDSDPDGDALTVTTAAADHGLVAINVDGTITYTPDADFNGDDTIRYTVSDGEGGTSVAMVSVIVDPVDDAPRPADIQTTYALSDGQRVDGIAAGSFADPDGDALTYAATGLPPGLSIDPATGAIAGTLGRDGSQTGGGTYVVHVTATDAGGLSTSRDLVLQVTNPAPVAIDDQATVVEDGTVTLTPLGNDRDPDGDALTVVDALAAHGRTIVNADGTVTYTPEPDYAGPDSIRYTIRDADGAEATATIAITVLARNHAPVAGDLPARTVDDGAAVSIALGDVFSDRDGDPLSFAATGLPAGLSFDPTTGALSGTILPGSVRGGPAGDGRYVITITATDPSGASVDRRFALTVSAVAPIARDDAYTTAEDTPVVLPVLANDTDGDGDRLTIVDATTRDGSVAIDGDRLVFTPAADFNGVATVTYTIADPAGNRATATATITVIPVPDAPVAAPLPAPAARDGQAVTLDLGGFFRDGDGDRLSFAATGLPTGLAIDPDTGRIAGTLDAGASRNGPYQVVVIATDPSGRTASSGFAWTIVNPAPAAADDRAITGEDHAVVIPVLANDADPDGDAIRLVDARAAHGQVAINDDGTLTYTPDADFNGEDVISYTIVDADGARAGASVLVTVTAVDDAPVALGTPGPVAAAENAAVAVDAARLFTDVDGDRLRYAATGLPPGLAIDAATGAITGTIAPGARDVNGGLYRATITATDPAGAGATTTVDFRVTNRPPDVIGEPAALARVAPEGNPVRIDAGALFADPDREPLVFTAADLPPGLLIDPATGTITGSPARGDAAARSGGVYQLVVTATDRSGAAASATIPLTVINRPPIARDDVATVREDTAVTIPVLDNDRDPGGDPLTVVAAAADHGTVTINADGSIAYRPSADFAGADLIRYTVSDGQGGTAEAIVRVTVAPVNDAPVAPARDMPVDAVSGRPLVIDGLAGVTDVDGDALAITGATAAVGTVAIGPEGRLVYAAPLGFVGTTSITYTVSDGRGGVATGTILVRVADGRGADICQLLRIGRVSFPDPARAAVAVPTGGEMRNPLAVGSAVNAIRDLRGTAVGGRPVIDAVNAVRDLRGTAIDPGGAIAGEVHRLGRLVDLRDAGDRLFDQRWGDFLVKGATGFSAAADGHAGVMIESVVRAGAIYLEVRDTAQGNRAAIRSVEVFPAHGDHRPEWLRVDPRGLAIVERSAEMDELHLVVRVTREDGRVTTKRIVVQGATGEVELDRPPDDAPARRAHAPLHAAIQTPAEARATAAARLAASFEQGSRP